MDKKTKIALEEVFALYAIASTIEQFFPELAEEELMTIAKETVKASKQQIKQVENKDKT